MICVALSSGDTFYIDATLEDVQAELNIALSMRALVQIGERVVNPFQVAQLTVEKQMSTIHTPETLKEAAYDATGE